MAAKKASKRKSAKSAKKAMPETPSMEQCCTNCNCGSWTSKSCSSGGCVWFLGFVGAVIYYLSTATGFWNGVLGILKALVWPAMLVFKLLGM